MNKISISILIILIITSANSLNGQKIFRDGFVIKNNGETLNGLVAFSMNQRVPSECLFKRFDLARVVKYKPDEIKAFGYFGGNRYVSGIINNRVTFLEVIISGEIILYQKDSKYYIEKGQLSLTELKKGVITASESNIQKSFKTLPDFLNYITEGKPGAVSEKFEIKKDIVNLITSYNKNSGSPYSLINRNISEKQVAQKSVESGGKLYKIGIMTGVDIYLLNLKPVKSVYLPAPESEISNIHMLSIERSVSKRNNRLGVRIDFAYFNQSFYCYNERVTNLNDIYRNDASFSFSALKIPLTVQYSFTGRRIIPYINSGIAYQLIFKSDYQRTEEVENNLHIISTTNYNDIEFSKKELGVVAGAGVRTRLLNNINLHLEARAEYGTGIFNPVKNKLKYMTQNSIETSIVIGLSF